MQWLCVLQFREKLANNKSAAAAAGWANYLTVGPMAQTHSHSQVLKPSLTRSLHTHTNTQGHALKMQTGVKF